MERQDDRKSEVREIEPEIIEQLDPIEKAVALEFLKKGKWVLKVRQVPNKEAV
jgi:hypothetical protein